LKQCEVKKTQFYLGAIVIFVCDVLAMALRLPSTLHASVARLGPIIVAGTRINHQAAIIGALIPLLECFVYMCMVTSANFWIICYAW
jgi:hypothetical protein